jgi:hypothetical protein
MGVSEPGASLLKLQQQHSNKCPILWCRGRQEKIKGIQGIKKFPNFTEIKDSLPCSQVRAIGI